MKIRADIASYLHQGYSNAHIADLVGVHHSTVARARRDLGLPNLPRRPELTHRDRLLTEDLPTGRIRDYGPVPRRDWTPAEQAAHRNDLLAALRNEAA